MQPQIITLQFADLKLFFGQAVYIWLNALLNSSAPLGVVKLSIFELQAQLPTVMLP